MRMKILYILDFVPLGTRTFDQYLLHLVDAATLRDCSLRFVFASEPTPGFCEILRQEGTEWFVLSFPLTWNSWARVEAHWPGYTPDVVFTSFLSTFTWPLIWQRARKRVKRLVVSDESSGIVKRRGGVAHVLRFIRGRIVSHYVDGIRTVSEYIRQRDVLAMGLSASKVRTICNGIDLDHYPFKEREDSTEGLRILYIGQLIPEKGIVTLVASLTQLKDAGHQFRCRIAGAGLQEQDLRHAVDVRGLSSCVSLVGFCKDPLSQYEWADVVVVPSLWAEAFGLVAIEAMATGAVVIVSDMGALPEVVGDAGIVYKAGAADELTEALLRLRGSSETRSNLAKKARMRVEDKFSMKRVVTEILEYLQHVCNN